MTTVTGFAVSTLRTPSEAVNGVVIEDWLFWSFRHRFQVLVQTQLPEIHAVGTYKKEE